MKTILVTGGAGFIGSAVIRHLINDTEHKVINVDKLTYAGNLESLISVSDNSRYSFEQVLGFDEWPYGDKPVVVMSNQPLDIPFELSHAVSASSEEPRLLVKRLAEAGAEHIYVDGGLTVQRFLSAGLIDNITITVIPILLGEGRPLFGPLEKDLPLSCIGTTAYECGFVQLRYALEHS